jgi:geranylgeranyl diphosphate synthase type I
VTDVLDREDLRSRVQAVVDATLDQQRSVLAELGDELTWLVEHIASLLGGGKRLRAGFLYWGYRACGGVDSDALVRLATAMEFFQAGALIHDDVMDDSDTRRGRPALHRAAATRHSEAAWTGSPGRYGQGAAILAGNLCLAWCDELVAGCGLPAPEVTRARPVFDIMRTQLMGGQLLDLSASAQAWAGMTAAGRVDQARHVIRYKSAKYTIEHPILIGANAAGAAAPLLSALSAYGMSLGEAFQLRDDLLGVFGDSAVTGKPAGDDLREGKRTALVAMALENATDSQAAQLERRLGDPFIDDEGVAALRDILIASGAAERVEAMVSAGARAARAALAKAPGVDPAAAQVLDHLIDVATSRTA